MTALDFWHVALFAGALIAAGLVVFVVLIVLYAAALLTVEGGERALVSIRQSALGGVPVAITGTVVGYLAGASRDPVVDALIPAVLTFIGGVTIYLSGKGRFSAYRVGFVTLAFAVSLIMGVGLGSTVRQRAVAEANSVAALKTQADQEFLVRRYRQGLGLPPEPPPRRPLE